MHDPLSKRRRSLPHRQSQVLSATTTCAASYTKRLRLPSKHRKQRKRTKPSPITTPRLPGTAKTQERAEDAPEDERGLSPDLILGASRTVRSGREALACLLVCPIRSRSLWSPFILCFPCLRPGDFINSRPRLLPIWGHYTMKWSIRSRREPSYWKIFSTEFAFNKISVWANASLQRNESSI